MDGKYVYFIGIGNLLHGLDSDLEHAPETDAEKKINRQEHMRRLAEVAHLMLDAGLIVIVTAVNLNRDDLSTIKTSLLGDRHPVLTVRLGEGSESELYPDLRLSEWPDLDQATREVQRLLQERGLIYRMPEDGALA